MKHFKFTALALVLIVVMVIVYTYTSKSQNKYTVNLSSQTVIKQMESLNRIETSQFTIEKVIDVGTSGNKFSQFLIGDRILLIAHGQVIAGFDLSKVKRDNIQVDGSTLRLTLPAPEILVTRLDSEQTRVYDRDQGLLTKGDRDLESEARQEAEAVIKDAACKGGILDEASKNARNQMTTQFKSLGFTTVVIDIPQGSC
ncbi:MAG: DUF4230 domain-containing protein [Candidatus Levybacteria bacterium]|nr:DUF4230 domain-containing protein [Candidatus Levybacteria bacterium]